ncbi:MAG TPA: hypothetical protein VF717_01230 [Pyrinomonadaceae bacterium]
MLNIETLDKVIAMVVVLLALSLFVQALQGWLKKLFKIKSLQIENSLVHLYQYVLNKNDMESLNRVTHNSPVLRTVLPGTTHPADRDPQVKALYDGVMREFKKVGRLTASGKLMLDSISQDDLLKFMGRMPVAGIIAEIFPDSATRFTEMRTQIGDFLEAYQKVKTEYQAVVTGPEFQKFEELLTPLLTDIDKFLSGASDDSGVILDDIAKLREIKPEEVNKLIRDLPARIAAVRAQVQAAEGKPEDKAEVLKALGIMEKSLWSLSTGIESIIAGFAHIRDLKTSIENWYDTVMQSFEERYSRSMRTWTIIISAFVVILMNANIINIYRDISTNDTKRAIFLQAAERYRAANSTASTATAQTGTTGAAPSASPVASPAASPAASPVASPGASTAASPVASPSPTAMPSPQPSAAATQGAKPAASPSSTPKNEIAAFYDDGKKVMNDNIDDLTNIGLQGPGWMVEKVPPFISGFSSNPGASIWRALRALLGWFIMTMLLSVGAPFWQDVLESLFGLKNKLRQDTGTKNVENKSGEGQPKAA